MLTAFLDAIHSGNCASRPGCVASSRYRYFVFEQMLADLLGKTKVCVLHNIFCWAAFVSLQLDGIEKAVSPAAIEKWASVLSVRPSFAIFAGNQGFFGIDLGKDRDEKENT